MVRVLPSELLPPLLFGLLCVSFWAAPSALRPSTPGAAYQTATASSARMHSAAIWARVALLSGEKCLPSPFKSPCFQSFRTASCA